MTVGRTPPPTRATVEGRAYLDLRAMAKKSGRANDEYLRLYALEGFLLRLAASDLLEYVIEMPCDQGLFVVIYRRKSHKIW